MNICNDDSRILNCKTSPLRIVWRFYLRSIFVSFESHSVNPVKKKTQSIFFPPWMPHCRQEPAVDMPLSLQIPSPGGYKTTNVIQLEIRLYSALNNDHVYNIYL